MLRACVPSWVHCTADVLDLGVGVGSAIVPGSHKKEKVEAIQREREKHWQGEGQDRTWTGPGTPQTFMEAFTSQGLTPSVTNVKAGDLVLFE